MKDTLDAFINPSIALSGFVGAIIIALLTNAKIRNNPFRLFVSLEESQFMSSWTKLFRFIYISLIIIVGASVYSILITSIDYSSKSSWAYKTINYIFNPVSMLITGLIIIIIIVLICIESIQKQITNQMYTKSSTKLRRSIFILVTMFFMLFYCMFFSISYGLFVNESLLSANKSNIEFSNSIELLLKIHLLDRSIIWQLFLLTAFYSLILFPVKKVSKFLGNSEGIVDVYLKSGKCFTGKYLLNSDIDEGVLICNSTNMFDPNKHLIPRMSIEYISFMTIYYSLGKQVVPYKSTLLVTPNDFDSKERLLLKSILEKK
jgi:hypothetical protein